MGELTKRLSKLYILALSLVAIFSIIGQILIQFSITDQQNDSRVINIAGRQRMLSQRICKTVILLTNPQIHKANSEYYVEDLKEILPLWHKCQIGLENGLLKLENDIKVKNSRKIDSILKENHQNFIIIYENANIILSEIVDPTFNKKEKTLNALDLILKYERSFLSNQDKVVFLYDSEAKKRMENLKRIELILFSITIFILFLEGMLIFRPTYFQIETTLKALSENEKKLKNLNNELILTNQSLLEAKEELLTVTEERIKQTKKEEKIRQQSLIEGQENERKRLALDLHDGIGQMLTGLKLTAEKINILNPNHEKEQENLSELKKLIHETISETRTISFNLMPSALNDFGIISTVKLLINQVKKSNDIEIIFNENIGKLRLDKQIEISIYRIVQEAVNNTIKYAKATQLIIDLNIVQDIIQLVISDNGQGFDLKKKNKNNIQNGLRNMQSRSEIHNGSFKISSKKNKGTKISLYIPLLN